MIPNFADLYHNNPEPNWPVYAATRDRIALKASEGTSFTDEKFIIRMARAKSVNLGRIAYHFARVASYGVDEFNHCLQILNAAGFDKTKDWLCLDVEDIDTPGYVKRARNNAREFVGAAVKAGFEHGLIYSYRYYLNEVGLKSLDLPPGWRNLWIATYTVGLLDSDISVPFGWTRDQIVARQYTDKAGVAGISSPVDDSRIINDWMKPVITPPVGDWWDTVDADTAKNLMKDAVREVFRVSNDGDINVPDGRLNNDNFIVDLMTMGRVGFNTENFIKATVDAVRADTALQGDDEANILAKLEEVKQLVASVSPVS